MINIEKGTCENICDSVKTRRLDELIPYCFCTNGTENFI